MRTSSSSVGTFSRRVAPPSPPRNPPHSRRPLGLGFAFQSALLVAAVFATLVFFAWTASYPWIAVALTAVGTMAVTERAYGLWRASFSHPQRMAGLAALAFAWSALLIFAYLILPAALRVATFAAPLASASA